MGRWVLDHPTAVGDLSDYDTSIGCSEKEDMLMKVYWGLKIGLFSDRLSK